MHTHAERSNACINQQQASTQHAETSLPHAVFPKYRPSPPPFDLSSCPSSSPHLTSLTQPCLPVRSSDPLRHPPELLPRRCVELGRFRPARQGEGTITTSNTTMALRLVRTTLRRTNVGWILFLRTDGRIYLGWGAQLCVKARERGGYGSNGGKRGERWRGLNSSRREE